MPLRPLRVVPEEQRAIKRDGRWKSNGDEADMSRAQPPWIWSGGNRRSARLKRVSLNGLGGKKPVVDPHFRNGVEEVKQEENPAQILATRRRFRTWRPDSQSSLFVLFRFFHAVPSWNTLQPLVIVNHRLFVLSKLLVTTRFQLESARDWKTQVAPAKRTQVGGAAGLLRFGGHVTCCSFRILEQQLVIAESSLLWLQTCVQITCSSNQSCSTKTCDWWCE